MNSLETSLYFFGFIMVELTLLFIGISTIIGVTLVYISADKLQRWLSHKGAFGNVLGALMGALTPFCACSTIRIRYCFLEHGAWGVLELDCRGCPIRSVHL